MSWSVNKNQKCCATCANWSGPRSVNSFCDTVTTEGSYKPTGKCYIDSRVGGFANGPSADWCCGSKYTKWSVLK